MRMTLADVKKRIARRDGEQVLTPYLLRRHDLVREMQALIDLYEASVGSARGSFPVDRPAELIGDYRLARGLTICLEAWYEWRAVAWPGEASAHEAANLAERGIGSPTELRLALYDRVNERHGGYLGADARGEALGAFAAELGVAPATLDALLTLDAEAREALARVGVDAPTPALLAARYNQQVFEALLANSSEVAWRIAPPASGEGAPLGTVVKRVCFLARRMGVQYDVAFDASPAADVDADEAETPLGMVAERPALYAIGAANEGGTSRQRDIGRSAVRVTLYGPQDVTGAPQQYGERLARVCRALLGYRRAASRGGTAAFAGAELTGTARVYLRGTPMTLALDERMMRALRAGAEAHDAVPGPVDAEFDSGVEERLFAEFTALERAGEAHGWRLEREPEPVVAGDVIVIPDFTLTRGARRVYVEVAGYWRPEYRERKARKLRAVRGAVDLLVAAPESAREAFAALAGEMPLVWYRAGIGAPALLAAVDLAYDDFTARLASLDFARIGAEVARRGRIAPLEAMTLLRCYSRNELGHALSAWERAPEHPAEWVDGLGLCARGWLDDVLDALRWVVLRAPGERIGIGELAAALGERLGVAGAPADELVETLVARAGLHLTRSSLFAAQVTSSAEEQPEAGENRDVKALARGAGAKRATQPRPSTRRKERVIMVTPSLFLPPEPGETGGG
jgi:predicted nuclease of restriction endonuclease-like RecB superfamily